MTKNNEIFYIAGAGKSGSTMLDAVLGTLDNSFSAGELVFYTSKGLINNEYCACGATVPECEFWGKVATEWEAKRNLSLQEYDQLNLRFHYTKNIHKLLFQYFFPSEKFREYIKDTTALFDAIYNQTGKAFVVDSSKLPARILILRKVGFDVKVVYLKRRFISVLNSNRKSLKKNLEAGVEHDIRPRSFFSVLKEWLSYHILINLFSIGNKKVNVKYESVIYDLKDEIQKVREAKDNDEELLKNRGPFYPRHLVAGNKIRMDESFYVDKKPRELNFPFLNDNQKRLSKVIDALFY